MKDKINVAELLRNCPKGMELDCTMYDNVVFDGVSDDTSYPIDVLSDTMKLNLTKTGGYSNSPDAKCVIFPKGKTTWEGFVPPSKFKDGDVVTSVFQGVAQGTGIFDYEEQSEAWIHVCINLNNEFFTDGYLGHVYDLRLATEEEKQKLFQAIKEHGYKWNAETKTLEKSIIPQFKVGDRVRNKNYKDYIYDIHDIIDKGYRAKEINADSPILILFGSQEDNYELVPDKFDINTLKPFDKVLVRNKSNEVWTANFYSHYDATSDKPFICVGWSEMNEYRYCIPYEVNNELLGTTNNTEEYGSR